VLQKLSMKHLSILLSTSSGQVLGLPQPQNAMSMSLSWLSSALHLVPVAPIYFSVIFMSVAKASSGFWGLALHLRSLKL
jgi:hypothetical protein